ncbi:MAG: hypothetical protein LBN07_00975 [Christensenellaceae bacterium]|jgi:hypothetical protein|nr:hypothetical protein [Christensenellaceae bacterium]
MSKTWRSILYAMGSLSALCIFIAIMITVVPQNEERFLIFSTNKIEININSEVDLKNIKIQTNLPHNAIEFSSEDESIFMIENNKIKPVGIGSGKLLAQASVGDKVYHNSVLVEVKSLPADDDDIDFGVQLCYKGSVYDFAGFNQDINLYLPGGTSAEHQAAEAAGFFRSFYFDMPSGVDVSADGLCVSVTENIVTASGVGNCLIKVTNKNIGKFKTVKVFVSGIPLTDVVLSCDSSLTLEVGQSMTLPAVQFTPSFASDFYKTSSFDIKNSNIVYFDTDRFVAKSVGQTQIVFKYGEIEKTVQIVVMPKAQEIVAEFLMIDHLGRATIRVQLFLNGALVGISSGAVSTKFIIDGTEYDTLNYMSCGQDLSASMVYDYVYKVSGALPNEFAVKFYLTSNPEIFEIVYIVIS